jgi:tetratricopeptide (TPR) repeat protein
MILKKAPVFALLLFVSTAASWAQYQGRINGRALDPSGNPVDKAEVTLVSQRTSTIRYESRTDKEGRFVQVGLMPGYYLLSVKKAGFAPGSKEIKVGVAGEESVEITLKTVDAEAAKSYSAADKSFLNGNKLYAERKYAEAAAAYEEAVGMSRTNWGYFLNLGLAYKKLDKMDESLAAFRKAVELSPESYSANKELGEALAKGSAFDEARKYYQKAVDLSPDDPDAHYNLGACLTNTGEQDAALEHFLKTTALKPDYADAYYQMGTIYIGRNMVPEAVQSLETFLELAPAHEKAPIAKQLLEYLKK